MTVRHCSAIAIAVAIVSIAGCSSSKKTNTPSLREIYSEQAIAALKSAGEMRVDRITRTPQDSISEFGLKEYRVVQPGRSLTAEDFIVGNDCHLAVLQTANSREDVNLTEKTSTLLSAICEHAFQ